MSEIHWVKLSTAMFDDEKIKAIRSMPSGNDICLIWIQLISLAGRVNDHGQIYLSEDVPYTEVTLSNSVGHPVGTVRLALQTFKKMGMVEMLPNDRIALVNWEKYQNIEGLDKVRQLTRERTRKYRERLLLECDATVTSRDGTDLDLDSDSEEEKKKKDCRAKARPTVSCEQVVNFLNEATHRRYSASTKSTQRLVKARVNEGHTLDDFETVIEDRVRKWGSDPKMLEYLRPETLFGTKFDSYLAQAYAGDERIEKVEKVKCPICGGAPTGHYNYQPWCGPCGHACE
jgi:predicted phage replisome organizer/uncharacterized phage protein (TIGR02220 family)